MFGPTDRRGWPQKVERVPSSIWAYWTISGELHQAEGLLFKGRKIIIPTALRPDMFRDQGNQVITVGDREISWALASRDRQDGHRIPMPRGKLGYESSLDTVSRKITQNVITSDSLAKFEVDRGLRELELWGIVGNNMFEWSSTSNKTSKTVQKLKWDLWCTRGSPHERLSMWRDKSIFLWSLVRFSP